MIEITGVCKRDNLCVECDDLNCLRAGDPGQDCPRYHCIYSTEDPSFLECEKCLWLKGYIQELKKGGQRNDKNRHDL